MGRLQGKRVVILGASDARSLGAATAKRITAEGAKVIVAARRLEGLEAVAKATGAIPIRCDITNEQDLADLAQKAVDKFGGLDVAINYAGVEVQGAILEASADDFRRASDVHFVGAAMFFKHMAAVMKDGGSLITTSTLTAKIAPPGLSAYAGSKAATDHMVRIVAGELGPMNIRVNAIAPGFTKTAMTSAYFEMEAVKSAFLKETPLGRFVTVDDIAETALWLASDEAFVTGQVIDVTGGQSLRRMPMPEDMA